METRSGLVWAIVALLAGCGGKAPERKQEPAAAAEEADPDREILARATSAVNEAVFNAADCALAKPTTVRAYATLDEARGRVRAAVSLQMLDTLKGQLDRVAPLCP